MKRSGPLRRNTPLKRSEKPMRRRSQSNSRPAENLEVREAYRAEKALGGCELTDLLDRSGWDKWENAKQEQRRLPPEPNHVHHIRHVGVRADLSGNLIYLSPEAHRLVHRYPIEGSIACWYVKWAKCDLDQQELWDACGFNVVAWLDRNTSEVPFFEALRQELLAGLVL